jgi:hypothetical protein
VIHNVFQSVSESLRFFRAQVSAVFVPNLLKQCACDSVTVRLPSSNIELFSPILVSVVRHHNPPINAQIEKGFCEYFANPKFLNFVLKLLLAKLTSASIALKFRPCNLTTDRYR